jgi:hypothetical protein
MSTDVAAAIIPVDDGDEATSRLLPRPGAAEIPLPPPPPVSFSLPLLQSALLQKGMMLLSPEFCNSHTQLAFLNFSMETGNLLGEMTHSAPYWNQRVSCCTTLNYPDFIFLPTLSTPSLHDFIISQ